MNLPNRLTVARVALIPVMVILMYVGGTVCNLLAAAVFGLAAFGRRIKSGAGEQAGCAGADDNAVVNHAGEFLSF